MHRTMNVLCVVAAIAANAVANEKASAIRPQDDPVRPVGGRVLDELGRPVRGAQVWLMTPNMMDIGDSSVLSQARTDDAGRFQLSLQARWSRLPMTLRQELGIVATNGHRIAGTAFFAHHCRRHRVSNWRLPRRLAPR